MDKTKTEQYGVSPVVEILKDIKRFNEASEATKAAACAVFVEDKMKSRNAFPEATPPIGKDSR